MKYINKGKRDILIFPQFTNIEKIENIRKQYDELYKILPPHITLAFPFESSMSNEELKDRLMQALKSVKPFEIVMSGVSLHKDENIKTNYIFLNVVSGVKEIKILHNEIYEKVLSYFGMLPSEALIFEDSEIGIQSARNAGINYMVITQ